MQRAGALISATGCLMATLATSTPTRRQATDGSRRCAWKATARRYGTPLRHADLARNAMVEIGERPSLRATSTSSGRHFGC